MTKQRGTLHILCNFYDAISKAGIYDVAFTSYGGDVEITKSDIVRRFYGEQELSEFLKKHLQRDADEVAGILQELQLEHRARISGLEVDPKQLREWKLAA